MCACACTCVFVCACVWCGVCVCVWCVCVHVHVCVCVCVCVCVWCGMCVCVCIPRERRISTLEKLHVCRTPPHVNTPSLLTPHLLMHTHPHSYIHPSHTYRPCQLQSILPQCLVLVLSSVPAPSFPTLKKWQEMSVSHRLKHHFQITMETKAYLAELRTVCNMRQGVYYLGANLTNQIS